METFEYFFEYFTGDFDHRTLWRLCGDFTGDFMDDFDHKTFEDFFVVLYRYIVIFCNILLSLI